MVRNKLILCGTRKDGGPVVPLEAWGEYSKEKDKAVKAQAHDLCSMRDHHARGA